MTPLETEYLQDGQWVLKADLEYQHPERGLIVVPKGFCTDLDSVPRLPLAYWLVKNCSVIGAVVHDYLYFRGALQGRLINRELADLVFLEIMEDEGVSWWQRRMIYRGVRMGGWLPWRRYRALQAG